VRMITDATGAVVARYDYLPFGELWPIMPPPTPDVRQFAGKERDSETGLDYFGARYYRAVSGRFVTVDPVLNIKAALADPQRWNRYAYAANNPQKFIDPDGRDPLLVTGGLGAAVFAVWKAYVNVQQGRPWYANVGVEASKGFVLGATLGLAAPALAGVEAITAGPIATTVTTAATKSSGDLGRIIGWGAGQSAADVMRTVRTTRELTAGRVLELAQQGVTRDWVEKQLGLYQKALEAGGSKLENNQLLPRIELMKTLLEKWPLQ
ncbi:MAG: RHS repeat-associated core domain-containing protein, partial [Vicinamibacterales bacterium]